MFPMGIISPRPLCYLLVGVFTGISSLECPVRMSVIKEKWSLLLPNKTRTNIIQDNFIRCHNVGLMVWVLKPMASWVFYRGNASTRRSNSLSEIYNIWDVTLGNFQVKMMTAIRSKLARGGSVCQMWRQMASISSLRSWHWQMPQIAFQLSPE